jgi:DNA-binding protein WhiA
LQGHTHRGGIPQRYKQRITKEGKDLSFAIQAKQSLCTINVKKDCCRRALLYGILIFAVNFEEDRIRLITESDATSALTLKLLKDLYHIDGNLYVTEKKQADEDGEAVKSHKITVSVKSDIRRILEKLGYQSSPDSSIHTDLFSCENCRASFLRGAFLSAGLITNPEASYHLEIQTKDAELAGELIKILEGADVSAKSGSRKSQTFVYIKSSEQIENFLAYIGASEALFEIMNSRILKSAKNDANRIRNCDTANLTKTVSASKAQTDAINEIISNGKIELLPPELKETALLRLEYPELSIKDFGMMFEPPISKSGVNHRLKKIMDFAENN